MAFDQTLARRVRAGLGRRAGLAEKTMFGGIAFLLHGNMACGVLGSDLIARLGDEAAAALAQPGVRPFDITGRPMRGWVIVESRVLHDDAALAAWVRRCAAFAASLPKKPSK